MIERPKSTNSIFQPLKDNGIIQLPSIPRLVTANIFKQDGRVIPEEQVPAIQKTIEEIVINNNNTFADPEQMYISKNLFPTEMGVTNSFIRIGKKDFAVIKEVIGTGQQENAVYLAQDIQSGDLIVLKKVKISGSAEEQRKVQTLIERETAALHAVENSPKSPIRKPSKKEKETQYAYIFMQLAKGCELSDLLEKERSRDGFEKIFVCRPLISPLVRIQLGLNLIKQEINLADKGFWHLDLKPRNVMVDLSKQSMSLIDLGMSRRMDESKNVILPYITGTDIYLPAEMRELATSQSALAASVSKEMSSSEKNEDSVVYNEKTEVYALGLTLAELFGLYNFDEAYACHNEPFENWLETKFIDADTSEANEYFTENRSMPKEALIEVLQLILDMTAEVDKRIGLAESYKRLDAIKNKYFAEAKVKIALVDVTEFLGLSAENKMDFLKQFTEIKTMKDSKGRQWQERAVDEIVLIDTSGKVKDIADYLEVKHQIEKAYEADTVKTDDYLNLIVANEVITGNDPEHLKANVARYVKERDLPTTCINSIKPPNVEEVKVPGPQ